MLRTQYSSEGDLLMFIWLSANHLIYFLILLQKYQEKTSLDVKIIFCTKTMEKKAKQTSMNPHGKITNSGTTFVKQSLDINISFNSITYEIYP